MMSFPQPTVPNFTEGNGDNLSEGASQSSGEPLPIPPRHRPDTDSALSTNSSHRSSRRERGSRPNRDLALLLTRQAEEMRELKNAVQTLSTQLRNERQKAADVERKARELVVRLKDVNMALQVAENDGARASQELVLYKEQLRTAQDEIHRAQKVFDAVDAQRIKAEHEAARARTSARSYKRQLLIAAAREQGRQMGWEEARRQENYLSGSVPPELTGPLSSVDSDSRRRSEATFDPYFDEEFYDEEGDEDEQASRNDRETLQREASVHERHSPPHIPPPPILIPPPIIPPILPVPPIVQDTPVEYRPRSSQLLSPRRHPAFIPPENFIPQADSDLVIRIPPAHEFSRPTPSPELTSTIPLAPLREDDVTPTSRRPRATKGRSRRHSSPESNSTTLSQMEIINQPVERPSPLSVIPEIRSEYTSPNPQSMRGSDLRRQSSWGGGSARDNVSQHGDNSIRAGSSSHRSQVLSNPKANLSMNGGSIRSRQSRRGSNSEYYTQDRDRPESDSQSDDNFGIAIQPPSRPQSVATEPVEEPPPPQRDLFHLPSTPKQPPTEARSGTPFMAQPPPHFVQTGFTPMSSPNPLQTSSVTPRPQGMPGTFQEAGSSRRYQVPVVPDPRDDSDEESVSSGMSAESANTLTTSKDARRRATRSGEAQEAPLPVRTNQTSKNGSVQGQAGNTRGGARGKRR